VSDSVSNAQPIVDHLPAEWACTCRVCNAVREEDGRPQVGRLSTEDLKRHFLLARHDEFVRVDTDVERELDWVTEVGRWVVDNERPYLQAKIGERLGSWAAAVR
jgi:hypothetical protein